MSEHVLSGTQHSPYHTALHNSSVGNIYYHNLMVAPVHSNDIISICVLITETKQSKIITIHNEKGTMNSSLIFMCPSKPIVTHWQGSHLHLLMVCALSGLVRDVSHQIFPSYDCADI